MITVHHNRLRPTVFRTPWSFEPSDQLPDGQTDDKTTPTQHWDIEFDSEAFLDYDTGRQTNSAQDSSTDDSTAQWLDKTGDILRPSHTSTPNMRNEKSLRT
ncbi:hypothetical protein QYM36_002835 [Artemia franciscana]|uniref:Uncharacterized protein n=1 Tax=Artemia franciscana TaxID=6661 RepID=A0AA88LI03_ARTSF|nr:hypothetical protein QYM36_002835 [Artemia franciscana]